MTWRVSTSFSLNLNLNIPQTNDLQLFYRQAVLIYSIQQENSVFMVNIRRILASDDYLIILFPWDSGTVAPGQVSRTMRVAGCEKY